MIEIKRGEGLADLLNQEIDELLKVEDANLLEAIYDKNPHAFDRVNIIPHSELKRVLEQSDSYHFDPSYTIDENENVRIKEVSLNLE